MAAVAEGERCTCGEAKSAEVVEEAKGNSKETET